MVVEPHRLEGCAAALAALPSMGPRRLSAITRCLGLGRGWDDARRGDLHRHAEIAATMGADPAGLSAEWAAAARGLDPRRWRDTHREAGVEIVLHGTDRYPAALAADIEPPVALFVRGDLDRLVGPRVAVVGTRRATSGGRQTAAELGADLAVAGVRVVSGLALGIDGAAHQGALRAASRRPGAAPVVGVVGTGLDVVYPRQHRELWNMVAERGVLVSELPLGTPPSRWRFPARNRLIAALSDIVVVVESHAKGGALLTVDEAVARDRPVMVVPGSVRSPASAGTNELLHAGAAPACSSDDVLRALDLSSCDRQGELPLEADDEAPPLDAGDAALLELIGGDPVSLDRLAAECGQGLGELSLRLVRLEHAGRIVRAGGTVEQVRPR